MNLGFAMLLVGLGDLVFAAMFHSQWVRMNGVLREWPQPGPYSHESGNWRELSQKVHLYFVLQVVCLNTGAAFVSTGLLLMFFGIAP